MTAIAPKGLIGHDAAQWESQLDTSLKSGDLEAVQAQLDTLKSEVDRESGALDQLEQASFFQRFQPMGEFQLKPGQKRALGAEIASERRVLFRYSETLTRARLPAPIWPFLKMTNVPLVQVEDHQFEGFDKFYGKTGGSPHRAVCFFTSQSQPDQAPANFFMEFDPRRGAFTVDRAYKQQMPKGAGVAVVVDMLRDLCPPGELKQFKMDNVVNRQTFDAYVEHTGDGYRLRPDADFDSTVLGRFTLRTLKAAGYAVDQVRPSLDGFGRLRIVVDVKPA